MYRSNYHGAVHMSHQENLKGCKPDPLMSYLKALGVFRVVVQQADPDARAWWHHDEFHLQSALDRNMLLEFFLERYQPSPIASPWTKGSGFFPSDNVKAMSAIKEQSDSRFLRWQEVLATSSLIWAEAQSRFGGGGKEAKGWILAQCRMRFPDDALDWLDASYVLAPYGAQDRVDYPPLLGTGGNDGRLDFSNNFMQNVLSALGLDQKRNESIKVGRLEAALFRKGSPQLMKGRSTGFYHPGSVRGANASAGFKGERFTNPWDYVLMIEGVLLFGGAVSRRLGLQAAGKAAFPFTVDNSPTGYGTSAAVEYDRDASRAEFWTPLWSRPAKLEELKHLVAEGRAQVGRRQAGTGSEMARAVAGLGVERGVDQFQRYGFIKRSGKSFLATPLGRFHVRSDRNTSNGANALMDLDRWLGSLHRNTPELGVTLSRVERTIIEFSQRGHARDLQNVLIAVGQAEQAVAKSGLRQKVAPIRSLSRDWMKLADDKSAEFRLARSLAAIRSGTVGPIRLNLEPVSLDPHVAWQVDSTSCVWTTGSVTGNMMAVLQRRCLDSKTGSQGHAPLESASWAHLVDIEKFLHGKLDIQRIASLVLPLSFVQTHVGRYDGVSSRLSALHAAYAAMKLTLLPERLVCRDLDIDVDVWMEPSMFPLLRAGRVKEAYRVAYRRLRVSGLRPVSEDPGIPDRSELGRRLAAALLFPVGRNAWSALAKQALRRSVQGTQP